MKGSIRVGNLFGIPFYIHPSWFLVLSLMTLTLGVDLAYQTNLPGIFPWLLGLLASLLLFASVLAHELGHSFVAQSQGIKVKSITLFIFGGLATLEKESNTPLEAFLVAIAGPVVSLIIFSILLLVETHVTMPLFLRSIVSLLATINLILALFNMIPGLPLDGGNVLKAIVWKITGNPQKGIIFAGHVGEFFGWTAVMVGLLGTLNIIPFGSIWTALVGWFLLQNAGIAAQSAEIEDRLKHYLAKEAITPNSPIVRGDLSIREFVNEYIIGKKAWQRFLVTDENGILIGVIPVEKLRTIPTSQWNEIRVAEVMNPKDDIKTVVETVSLLEVVKLLEQNKESEITVVREDGYVLGLVERQGIVNFLQSKLQTS